jgi:hypothetical protein
MLELAAGREQDAERYFEQARAQVESWGSGVVYQRWGRGALAERDLVAGDGAAALAHLKPLLDRPGMREWEVEPLLPLLAWAQLALDRDDEAAATLAAAKARCGKLWLVDVQRVEALLAIKQERWQEAAASLDEALSMCRAIPYPYAEVKALYVYSQLYTATSKPQQAHEQYEAALVICDRLGEGLYRTHIARALAALKDGGGSNTGRKNRD